MAGPRPAVHGIPAWLRVGARCAPRDSFDSLGLYPNVSRIDWRRCPIILADEEQVFDTLGIAVRFIDCVTAIKNPDALAVKREVEEDWGR
jgi:hypothetical protein